MTTAITLWLIWPDPPVADFHVTRLDENCFRFQDKSTGNVSVWRWDFGDGNSDSSQNSAHEYTAPGRYTVTLSVKGLGGQASSQRAVVIEQRTVDLQFMAAVRLNDTLRRLPPNISLTSVYYDLECVKSRIAQRLIDVGYDLATPAFDMFNRLLTHARESREEILRHRNRYERSVISVEIREQDGTLHVFVVVAAAERRRPSDYEAEVDIESDALDNYRDRIVAGMEFEPCKENGPVAWFFQEDGKRFMVIGAAETVNIPGLPDSAKPVDLAHFAPGEWICCHPKQQVQLHDYCFLKHVSVEKRALHMDVSKTHGGLYIGTANRVGHYDLTTFTKIERGRVVYDSDLGEVRYSHAEVRP